MRPSPVTLRRQTRLNRYALPGLIFLLSAVRCPLTAYAQAPIIVETTGQPDKKPKPKPPPPKPVPPPKPAEPAFVAPKLLWKTLVKPVEGGILYGGDALFLGGGTTLHKLDEDGRPQWTAEVGEQRAAAALDDRRVFFGGEKGTLYAFTQRSGSLLWQFTSETGAAIQNAPAVGGGKVFVECLDNNLYALNAANGQLLWKFPRPDGSLGYSAPLFDSGAVYIAGETTLYKLDAATGKELWKAFVGGKSLSTPALSDKAVIVGGDGTGVSAFARDSGKPLWNFPGKSEGDWFGTPLVAGNRVCVGTYKGFVYALNAAAGTPRWAAPSSRPFPNPPRLRRQTRRPLRHLPDLPE